MAVIAHQGHRGRSRRKTIYSRNQLSHTHTVSIKSHVSRVRPLWPIAFAHKTAAPCAFRPTGRRQSNLGTNIVRLLLYYSGRRVITSDCSSHHGSTGGLEQLRFSPASHSPPTSNTAPEPLPVRYGWCSAEGGLVAHVSTLSRRSHARVVRREDDRVFFAGFIVERHACCLLLLAGLFFVSSCLDASLSVSVTKVRGDSDVKCEAKRPCFWQTRDPMAVSGVVFTKTNIGERGVEKIFNIYQISTLPFPGRSLQLLFSNPPVALKRIFFPLSTTSYVRRRRRHRPFQVPRPRTRVFGPTTSSTAPPASLHAFLTADSLACTGSIMTMTNIVRGAGGRAVVLLVPRSLPPGPLSPVPLFPGPLAAQLPRLRLRVAAESGAD